MAKVAERARLEPGLDAASTLEEAGFRAGRPLETRSGAVSVSWDDRALALRSAVVSASRIVRRLQDEQRLTRGTLNGDPALSSFRLDDGSGSVGLIDWGSATFGPLLYDVASLCVLSGIDVGSSALEPLLEAYLAAAPVRADECGELPALVRLRWAVQAR